MTMRPIDDADDLLELRRAKRKEGNAATILLAEVKRLGMRK